jgi:hypothetical protein
MAIEEDKNNNSLELPEEKETVQTNSNAQPEILEKKTNPLSQPKLFFLTNSLLPLLWLV